jgi:hypothetical protein
MPQPFGDFPLSSLRDLHHLAMAHASSRADLSRQLSALGRRCVELTVTRCARNEERIKESMDRVDRLSNWRAATRARVQAAFR